jgi:hypothetical protein
MSLDSRISDAVEDLERRTYVDAAAGLVRLRQTNRRRSTTRYAIVAAAMVLLAAGAVWRLGGPPTGPTPAPAVPHVSNGLLLALTATGDTVVAAAGSLPHLPEGLPVTGHLEWSGDGTHLVHDTTSGTLVALDVESGGSQVLTDCSTPCLAAATRDLTRIAVAADSKLRIRSPDGETSVSLPGLHPGPPVWSPDGTRIAFSAPTGLYVVKADGSWLHRYWDPAPGLRVVPPTWSPDGSSLAYVAAAPLGEGGSGEDGLVPAEYRLLVFDVASGSVRRIATLGRCTCAGLAPAVAWSPDGELVAFTGVGRQVGVYTVPAQDGEVVRISTEQVGTALAWQPVID